MKNIQESINQTQSASDNVVKYWAFALVKNLTLFDEQFPVPDEIEISSKKLLQEFDAVQLVQDSISVNSDGVIPELPKLSNSRHAVSQPNFYKAA